MHLLGVLADFEGQPEQGIGQLDLGHNRLVEVVGRGCHTGYTTDKPKLCMYLAHSMSCNALLASVLPDLVRDDVSCRLHPACHPSPVTPW